MYFFFILFFISLIAIILMIGRKLLLLSDIEGHHHHHISEIFVHDVFDFDNIKHSAIKNGKKMGHSLIWIILKIYIISLNSINKKRKEIIIKIKNRLSKYNNDNESVEKKEVSKYIKIISEYRQKIRHIKHKIKKEEGIE
ncbi:MAG: hypothetical protein Q8L01_02615 [Candidatus Woesebacteria bacterium]|nr:hypothetical protein [Candidatus Woesebacteria bacterium]